MACRKSKYVCLIQQNNKSNCFNVLFQLCEICGEFSDKGVDWVKVLRLPVGQIVPSLVIIAKFVCVRHGPPPPTQRTGAAV
jgi:hypothetical protein